MIDLPHDISSDSYAGAVEQDIRQTMQNRYVIAFATKTAEDYGFSQEVFNPCGKINGAASEKGDRITGSMSYILIPWGKNQPGWMRLI